MIHRYFYRDRNRICSREALLCILAEPIVTEKSNGASSGGQYFFKVASWANKIQIRRAVEEIFSVRVAAVNTLISKGKTKRFRGRLGWRGDFKKAMVSLVEGSVIDFSDGKI